MLLSGLKALTIGILFGIPIGAVGALTIKRTVLHGGGAGLMTRLGSSAADLMYACLSVFGLTLVTDYMLRYQSLLSIVGGVFIIGMALSTGFKAPCDTTDQVGASTLVGCFSSAFMIALTNPATILTYMLAFSIFQIQGFSSMWHCVSLIGGIFVGTCSWWFFIVFLLKIMKGRSSKKGRMRLNQGLASMLFVLGVIILLGGI